MTDVIASLLPFNSSENRLFCFGQWFEAPINLRWMNLLNLTKSKIKLLTTKIFTRHRATSTVVILIVISRREIIKTCHKETINRQHIIEYKSWMAKLAEGQYAIYVPKVYRPMHHAINTTGEFGENWAAVICVRARVCVCVCARVCVCFTSFAKRKD
jgi:hypothetical protein